MVAFSVHFNFKYIVYWIYWSTLRYNSQLNIVSYWPSIGSQTGFLNPSFVIRIYSLWSFIICFTYKRTSLSSHRFVYILDEVFFMNSLNIFFFWWTLDGSALRRHQEVTHRTMMLRLWSHIKVCISDTCTTLFFKCVNPVAYIFFHTEFTVVSIPHINHSRIRQVDLVLFDDDIYPFELCFEIYLISEWSPKKNYISISRYISSI